MHFGNARGCLLSDLLSPGLVLTECPVSTADGVKGIDVAWLVLNRSEINQDLVILTRALEICLEILSPSNSEAEIREKRALYFYFDAGATEVWICNLNGSCLFFRRWSSAVYLFPLPQFTPGHPVSGYQSICSRSR